MERGAVAKTVLPFGKWATHKTRQTLTARKFFGAMLFWSDLVLAAQHASGSHKQVRAVAFTARPSPGVSKQVYVGKPQAIAAMVCYGNNDFQGRLFAFLEGRSDDLGGRERQRMISEIIKYLREIAQTCVSLARACPHRATALGLEEIAADMMAKAKELEEFKLE
jgi:hypothetical protein